MICFSCPSCKQTLEVEERGAGLIVPCPTCGKQLTIPWKVQPTAAKSFATSPADLWPRKRKPDVPPVVHAGVICLCVFAVASFIGLILLHSQLQATMDQLQQVSTFNPSNFSTLQLTMQNPLTMEFQMLPAIACLQGIFGGVALICAIVALATNHVNKGLALLVGTAATIIIFYLVEAQMAHNAVQVMVDAVNKQSAEMQQQLQRMFAFPHR